MNTQTTENYYDILQLTQEATSEEIKLAYLDMAGVWHPDRFTNSPRLFAKANEAMKRINTAYETLKNPDKRRQYDSALKQSTASTSHPETRRRPRKSEERPHNSAKPSEPSSEMLEQARKQAVKHIQRLLQLVELVASVQRRFGVVISVPPMLTEGTETALERVQMAGYRAVVELNDDADIKFKLLVSHVNRALEQIYKHNVQALNAAESKVNQEKQDTTTALDRVRKTYVQEMEISRRHCHFRQQSIMVSGSTVVSVLLLLLFMGFGLQANVVMILACSLCIFGQTYGVRKMGRDYEYIKARANVRIRLESEELVQQASFRLLNDEVTLRAAEDQIWLIQEVKGILKNI